MKLTMMFVHFVALSFYLISSAHAHPITQHSRDERRHMASPSVSSSTGALRSSRLTRNAVDQDILEMLEIHPPAPVTQLEHDEQGQCIFVKSEEGTYSYTSPGGSANEVCGLYVIAEPDQFVEFEFERFELDTSCPNGGILSVVDGWELNGQFFPGTKDHPVSRKHRYQEFCETKPQRTFRMSQNVGLLEFRIPSEGEGFKVHVRFTTNQQPCNAVLQKPQGIYTLRNYGRHVNCSVSIIFPESFRILASSVGSGDCMSAASTRNLVETGIMRQCQQNGETDYVEIRGGDGLDPDLMEVADNFCGVDSKPESHNIDVFCGNTAVRLVSSGLYENSVTIAFDLLLDWKSPPALTCPTLAGIV